MDIFILCTGVGLYLKVHRCRDAPLVTTLRCRAEALGWRPSGVGMYLWLGAGEVMHEDDLLDERLLRQVAHRQVQVRSCKSYLLEYCIHICIH